MVRERLAVVDGANVAYAEMTDDDRPRVANLEAVRAALEARGYRVVVIVDASLRHRVDDPDRLEELLDEGLVHQAPAGTDADYFLLETADRSGAIVVSNDTFASFRDDYPWIRERRLPLMIIHGHVVLYDEEVASDA